MKTIISAAVAVAFLAAATVVASAQSNDGAYCSTMKGDQNAGKLNCAYKTMAECESAVKGGKGTCTKNDKMMKK